jgi:hypothetical protein
LKNLLVLVGQMTGAYGEDCQISYVFNFNWLLLYFSDFSDALKCYYYHTRIEYTCDLDTFMMAVTNNYTALITDIGKPDLTCPGKF